MHLEYIARVMRAERVATAPLLATYLVGQERFAVEVGSVRDAAQIERLLRAAVAQAMRVPAPGGGAPQ